MLDCVSKCLISQLEFNQAKDKDSYVSDRKAGTVKTFINLSFVKVCESNMIFFF